MEKWYVINTKPHSEFKVINYLNYNNIQTFMPKILLNRSHAGKKDKVIKPLFPSYLFAAIDINNSSFRKINNTFGVKSILGYGKEPAEVYNVVIDGLMEITDSEGLVKNIDKSYYNIGQEIKIYDGPFMGFVGKFCGMKDDQRVMILLNILGRNLKLPLPGMHVSAY